MAGETVTVQRIISAPASEVWAALTTPEQIKQYFFGTDVDTDWEEGHPIKFHGDYKGRHFEDKGEVKEVEEGRCLSFTHWSEMSGKPDTPENYATVTYALREKDGRTEVKVKQTNCGDADETKKNWKAVLNGLKKTVEH